MSSHPSRRSLLPVVTNLILLLGYSVLLLSGIKGFTLWPQILEILYVCGLDPKDQFGRDPLDVFYIDHPLALRYLLMWPIIAFSLSTGVALSTAFSLLVFMLLPTMTWILARTLKFLRPPGHEDAVWDTTRLLTIWLCIALLMNGRLVIVFTGVSIIMYAQISMLIRRQHTYGLILLQLVGLLLCSVSSGTFMVAFCVVLAFLASMTLTHVPARKFIHLDLAICGALIAAGAAPLVRVYIAKNLAYFNHSLNGMLMHGPLRLLNAIGVGFPILRTVCIGFASTALIVMTTTYIRCLRQQNMWCPFILFAGFSFTFGILGYSALLTMLPAVTLMLAYVMPRLCC